MIKILIHIGYNKSATTVFQKLIFPKCENINYLSTYNNIFIENLRNLILFTDQKRFNLNQKFFTDQAKLILKEDKLNVISQGFFSDIFASKATYYLTNYNNLDFNFFKRNILRLKKIFSKKNNFELKIFYTFRDPEVMIASYFRERSANLLLLDNKFFDNENLLSDSTKNNKKKFINFLIKHFDVTNFDYNLRKILGKKEVFGYFVNNNKSKFTNKKFFYNMGLKFDLDNLKKKLNVNKKKQLKNKFKFNNRSFKSNFNIFNFSIYKRMIYYFKLANFILFVKNNNKLKKKSFSEDELKILRSYYKKKMKKYFIKNKSILY